MSFMERIKWKNLSFITNNNENKIKDKTFLILKTGKEERI